MKIRVARHTTNLAPLIEFYTKILVEILGSFNDHDGYDGVFLGRQSASWHLEFTVSNGKPVHQYDEDDILVFYTTKMDHEIILKKINEVGIKEIPSKNPYWNRNGNMFLDPDGCRVIIVGQE